jgi:inner membrane protein
LLLIPAFMVQSLIGERQRRRTDALREVSGKWGSPQLLTGPVLVVPYEVVERTTTEAEGKRPATTQLVRRTEYAYFAPDSLAISGTLTPERRRRGIYDLVVYGSNLQLRGTFTTASLAGWQDLAPTSLRWADAFVALRLSDLKGLRAGVTLRWDGQPHAFEAGAAELDLPGAGRPRLAVDEGHDEQAAELGVAFDEEAGDETLVARLPLRDLTDLSSPHRFALDLQLNGTDLLLAAPLARRTTLQLRAPWATPSAVGAFLPDQTPKVGPDGRFSARWRVLDLNRNLPQRWRTPNPTPSVAATVFGIRLMVPVDEYQKTMRVAKYALLTLSLTFLTFFFVELRHRRPVHLLQYLIVGVALVIFYTLLLALAEHLGFNAAYALATLIITGLVVLYARGIFGRWSSALTTAGVLLLLYGYIFVILQLEDYALLLGTLLLVVTLAVVMYLTRRTDLLRLPTDSDPPAPVA